MKMYITILIIAVIVSALAIAVWAETTMPFEDVQEGAFYYDAVSWAVENGITKGTSGTTFSPDSPMTRGQAVTFLYRYWQAFDKPAPAPVATSADAPMPTVPSVSEPEPTEQTGETELTEPTEIWMIQGESTYPSSMYSISIQPISDDELMLTANQIGEKFRSGETVWISSDLSHSPVVDGATAVQKNEINRLLNYHYTVVSAAGDELVVCARIMTFDNQKTIWLAAAGETPDYVQIHN